MTIHAQTLTNPGAESASTTGWTAAIGGGPQLNGPGIVNGVAAHSGSYYFAGSSNVELTEWYQLVTIDPSLEAAVDARSCACKLSAWHTGFTDSDEGYLYIECYAADGTTLLLREENSLSDPATWTQESLFSFIPDTTRYIRIGTHNQRNSGTQNSVYWDDFEFEISDDYTVDYPIVRSDEHQAGIYAVVSHSADEAFQNQSAIQVVAAAETSNGEFDVTAYQFGVYVLCRGMTDRRDLRAWPFTQDDHDFYVLQLGDNGTLVFDKLTGQWAQWRSPTKTFWRGNDGVQWEGMNICCDTESGILWRIDPEGRLDNEETPITSIVTGTVNTRMRKNAQCYMAELTVSEGEPPTGFDDGTVGVTLRTSDDGGQSFVSHGEVTGEGISEDITVRWYALGLMPAPGRVFEITDTGYARRIDGFNIEVGDESIE